jgi:sugar diacid utilization regulator
VPTVDELLGTAALSGLTRVSRGGGGRMVRRAWLAESLAQLEHAPPASFVLLSAAASAEVGDYRLDVALRWAGIGEVPALAALQPGRWVPTATAADIADRAGIALVSVPAEIELTGLLLAASREIEGGPARALDRALLALGAITRHEPAALAGGGPQRVLAAAAAALGTGIELLPADSAGTGVPVLSGGEVVGQLAAPGADGELATAARLVLPAAAAAVARIMDAAHRAEDVPIRSRGELLARLLVSQDALDDDLLGWARQVGLRIDGWHLAVRLEFDAAAGDPVRGYELLDAAARVSLQAVQSAGALAVGGAWNLARLGRAVVLAHVARADPGPQAGRRAARAAAAALDLAAGRFPELRGRAGIGAAHEGLDGLRASAAEARTVLSGARAAGRPDRVLTYDAVGIQRMLMEWYASGTAREAVREQLAPLERLGGARAETAIRTLRVYLDEQGSVARAARVLHLHRNAVAYRLQRISELAGIDLDDADQRLALQLACRARLLG